MKKAIAILIFLLLAFCFWQVLKGLPSKLEKIECIKAVDICQNYGGDCQKAKKCGLYE